jgi:hypothetical protein
MTTFVKVSTSELNIHHTYLHVGMITSLSRPFPKKLFDGCWADLHLEAVAPGYVLLLLMEVWKSS